jgi:hypothetical protein
MNIWYLNKQEAAAAAAILLRMAKDAVDAWRARGSVRRHWRQFDSRYRDR